MHLSSLLIDVGDNPDRPRPGRLWLRNLYRVHQRLCMAFPSDHRRATDPQFLRPFDPGDCPVRPINVPRDAAGGFLFRVDTGIDRLAENRAVILVQSASMPDWAYAFHNAAYLLAARPQQKSNYNPTFVAGDRLRFRLLANPTRKVGTKSGSDGRKNNGSRVPVGEDKLFAWLDDRAQRSGFSVSEESTTLQPGYVHVNKSKSKKKSCCSTNGDATEPEMDDRVAKEHQFRLRSVRYDGVLEVTDAAAFRETLIRGIGPEKAFGFGLLSVAPLHAASAEAAA